MATVPCGWVRTSIVQGHRRLLLLQPLRQLLHRQRQQLQYPALQPQQQTPGSQRRPQRVLLLPQQPAPLPNCNSHSDPHANVDTGSTTSLQYQNGKYNFRLSLPSGAIILSQSDNVGQVSLPIVTAGTNLLSKYVQIHVRKAYILVLARQWKIRLRLKM